MPDEKPTLVVEFYRRNRHVYGEADTVVINKGSGDGVDVGQRFLIYALSDSSLSDPATGEDLGRLEVIRGTGVVTHLQEKVATVKSDMTKMRRRRSSGFGGVMAALGDVIYDEEDVPFRGVERGDLVKSIP